MVNKCIFRFLTPTPPLPVELNLKQVSVLPMNDTRLLCLTLKRERKKNLLLGIKVMLDKYTTTELQQHPLLLKSIHFLNLKSAQEERKEGGLWALVKTKWNPEIHKIENENPLFPPSCSLRRKLP